MTVQEAEADYDDVQQYVRRKCLQHSIEYVEPSEHYKQGWLYEQMTDDITLGWKHQLDNPVYRLKFWTAKFQFMRVLKDPILNRFLVDRINDARRG